MSHVDQSASTLLQSLKGAPLSIVVALALHGAQSQRGLMALTGWKKQALRVALERLVDEGMVVRCNYRSWALREGLTLQTLLGARQAEACEGASKTRSDGEVRGKRLSRCEWEANAHSEGAGDCLSGSEWEADTHSEGAGDCLSESEWEADAHSEGVGDCLSEGEWEAESQSEGAGNRLSEREREADTLSGGEARSNRLSALTRDDHDHDVDPFINENQYHSNKHEARTAPKGHLVPSAQDEQRAVWIERLVQRLQRLDPPFAGAERWLTSVSLHLVEGWVQHLEEMERHERGRIRNEAAFLRYNVEVGLSPPASRSLAREPCPRCGKAYFGREGVCLVCAGVVVM